MTGCASCLAHMTPVIEHGIEASQRWKSLHTRRGVADRADRVLITRRKLFRVARCTRDVSRHLRRRAVVAPHMTHQAWKPRVLCSVMRKARVVLFPGGRKPGGFRIARFDFPAGDQCKKKQRRENQRDKSESRRSAAVSIRAVSGISLRHCYYGVPPDSTIACVCDCGTGCFPNTT